MEKGLEEGEVEELKFKKELIDVEIPMINKDCKILSEAISNPMFENTETNVEEAVKFL